MFIIYFIQFYVFINRRLIIVNVVLLINKKNIQLADDETSHLNGIMT